MPLSDREQQILAEIEKNLYDEDPEFARRTPIEERAAGSRNAVIGGLILVAGLVALVFFFITSNVPIGVVAFAAMVGGIVVLGSSLRNAFAAPDDDSPGFASRAFSGLEERFKQRYRKP